MPLLWEGFKAVWPSVAAGADRLTWRASSSRFQTMTPFWLPTINTALLLSSGVTLTIAHHALIANQRAPKRFTFMWLTVLLGRGFPWAFKVMNTYHAYNDLNLKLTSGMSTVLPSIMLTGFPWLSRVLWAC
jgi:cytochrome c oxidase subunit III